MDKGQSRSTETQNWNSEQNNQNVQNFEKFNPFSRRTLSRSEARKMTAQIDAATNEETLSSVENLAANSDISPKLDTYTGLGIGSDFDTAKTQLDKGAVFTTSNGESYDQQTLEAMSDIIGETPNNVEALLSSTAEDESAGVAISRLQKDFEFAQIESGQTAAGLSEKQVKHVVKDQAEAAKNNAEFVEKLLKQPAYEIHELEKLYHAGSREVLDLVGYKGIA